MFHLWKKKIIFPTTFEGNMLAHWRVNLKALDDPLWVYFEKQLQKI